MQADQIIPAAMTDQSPLALGLGSLECSQVHVLLLHRRPKFPASTPTISFTQKPSSTSGMCPGFLLNAAHTAAFS